MNRIIEYILDKLEVVDCIPEWLKKPLRNVLNKDIKKTRGLSDRTSTPKPHETKPGNATKPVPKRKDPMDIFSRGYRK